MKNLSLIFFAVAVVFCVSGILACCGKIRSTVIGSPGKWLITTAALNAFCAIAALGDFAAAIILLSVGSVLINAVKCLVNNKGDEKN